MRQILSAIMSVQLMVGGCGIAFAAPETVVIDGFSIDRTEVTIAAFRAFNTARQTKTSAESEGGGYEYSAGWSRRPGWSWATPYGKPGGNREPAVHVTWFEAKAYCRHVGGRLPTFAEWRKAAYTEMRTAPADGFANGVTYRYPVGHRSKGMNVSGKKHVGVGTTKRGVNGLYDMGANVWEWTADRRGDDALTAGGSWWYGPDKTQASGAQWKPAAFYAVYVGFRCVYDGIGSNRRSN